MDEKYKPVPVSAAVQIAKDFEKEAVIIISFDLKYGQVHTTTHTKDPDRMDALDQLAEDLSTVAGSDVARKIVFENLDSTGLSPEEEKKKLREIMKQLRREAVWIGEDGDMACVSSSERGALSKFRALMRGDVGDWEAKEIKLEDVGVGWLRLPTKRDLAQHGEEYEWYVTYKEKSPHEVFVYRA